MPASPQADSMSDAQYHELAYAVLNRIETTVDVWLEQDIVDIDSHRSGGLLELSLPSPSGGESKLIVNTQAPLQELWLAARSGGYHFRCVGGAWRDTKDAREFFAVLSEAASSQTGLVLRFIA